MKKRFDLIDAMKGFAILLVVFGHAIQNGTKAFDDNIFFKIIYAFHMPLFMFLAGSVVTYSAKMPARIFLKKKYLALVIPFISWYLASYFINGAYHTIAFGKYSSRVIFSPDYGLWFLWILFANFCFLVLTLKISRGIGFWAFPLVFFLVEWMPFNFLGIGLLKIHFAYFLLGYFTMKYSKYFQKYSLIIGIFSLAIFPTLASQWHRTEGFKFAPLLRELLKKFEFMYTYEMTIYLLNVILALSGIAITYVLVRYVIKNSLFYSLFCWLGMYTLDIYVSHQFLLYGIGKSGIKIFSSAIFALCSSLILAVFILRKNNMLNFLFLGGRKKTFVTIAEPEIVNFAVTN